MFNLNINLKRVKLEDVMVLKGMWKLRVDADLKGNTIVLEHIELEEKLFSKCLFIYLFVYFGGRWGGIERGKETPEQVPCSDQSPMLGLNSQMVRS